MTALALAGDTSAGTVEVDADCSVRYYCSWWVTYTAAPGERNGLSVTHADGYVDLHHAGATIAGCTPVDPQTARFTTSPGESVWVTVALGDGDDLARASGAIDGSTGGDVITGSGRLDGGPGRDHLSSAAGAEFIDGDSEPDRFDGSAEYDDMISFARARGVRFDLREQRTADADRDWRRRRSLSAKVSGFAECTVAAVAFREFFLMPRALPPRQESIEQRSLETPDASGPGRDPRRGPLALGGRSRGRRDLRKRRHLDDGPSGVGLRRDRRADDHGPGTGRANRPQDRSRAPRARARRRREEPGDQRPGPMEPGSRHSQDHESGHDPRFVGGDCPPQQPRQARSRRQAA
ncbi:hypothetical protein OJ998_15935 [Solirubrobacter taibaiensis]|nr:hypothetical protein [Solirubrobacter taibaiensis]